MSNIADALEKAGYSEGLDNSRSPDTDTPENNENSKKPNDNERKRHSNIESSKSSKSSNSSWDTRLYNAIHYNGPIPEIFKSLRSQILHPKNGGDAPKTILVTSASPKEGKSFVTANLGISLAHGLDQHCMLVDGDLRKPSLAQIFGLENSRGIVDHLRDNEPMSQVLVKTSLNKLSIVPSGKPPVNPAELLSSRKMQNFIKDLSDKNDDMITIFDSPPVLAASETKILASLVDSVIIVVRQGVTGKRAVQKIIDDIGREKLLGIVFNSYKVNIVEKIFSKPNDYYQGYY